MQAIRHFEAITNVLGNCDHTIRTPVIFSCSRRVVGQCSTDMENVTLETFQRSFQSLEDIVKCAICLVTARPNAVQCVNNHIICAECKADLTKCPTCQEPFSDEPLGHLVTQMLQALPQHCRYKNCGLYLNEGDDHENNCGFRDITCEKCPWQGLAHDLSYHLKKQHCKYENCREYLIDGDDHEKYCGFRETKCQECHWKGPVNALINHIKEDHKLVTIFSEINEICWWPKYKVNVQKTVISPIFSFGHIIWEKMSNKPELNYLCISYNLIPMGKPKHLFYARREFFSIDEKRKEYSCEIKIISDSNFDSEKAKEGLFVPLSLLPKCVDNDGKLRYKLFITKE